MFVRTVKGRNNEYAIIVRGYRDQNGKSRQKTVQNLGVVTDKNRSEIMAFGKRLIAQQQGQEFVTTGEEIVELSRQNWGGPSVIESMWQKFDLEPLLSKKAKALKLMLIDRIINPVSKLESYTRRDQYEGFEAIKLQDLYRALDLLDKKKDQLKERIFNKQKLYGKMSVVFFDVTTLYFESQKADDLKEFGYSKDCKFNEVQIVLSMVINSEGRPLTYEIFPGNTFEGNTLLSHLIQLKKKYNIDKVIIVADRGIGSGANLQEIKAAGFDYVVGAKLRSSGKAVKEEAIDPKGYKQLFGSDKLGDEDIRKYKVMKLKDCTWIALWSGKRASKDREDRNRLVARAKEMLASNQLKDRRGAKKYIQSDKSNHSLDLEKIEQDARFDGYYALSFSDETMSAEAIASAYHGLWKIEESFRTIKSFFEVRPMFHWTAKRISGHIMLNFISLVMENNLLLKLKELTDDVSHNKIRDAIAGMQHSILKIGSKNFASYATLESLQKIILKTLNINQPQNHMIT